MGSRKHIRAEKRKEIQQSRHNAILRNCPTSPRKMRLVADQIRGRAAVDALNILTHSPKEASGRLYKLLKSAISNWEKKNETKRFEEADLFVSEITVDSGRVLKRLRPAPQGRAYRVRKRSNHVTLVLDSRVDNQIES